MLNIVWDLDSSSNLWKEGRDDYRVYLFEIMQQLGIAYEVWKTNDWKQLRPAGVSLMLADGADPAWLEICEQYCAEGNAILLLGEPYGLSELLAAQEGGRQLEGWIEWRTDDALATGLQSSFHFFGGIHMISQDEYVQCQGSLITKGTAARGTADKAAPAVISRQIGRGQIAMICFDMMKTICLIQQGTAVVQDGKIAADGSVAVNDGILKTDDGTVLDLDEDRDVLEPGGVPFFLHPIVDELKIVFNRILIRLHQQLGRPGGQIWFWPEGITAVGHISHDTDGNSELHARWMLAALGKADIHSTWCTIMPGYSVDLYQEITAKGHELALHYNALGTEIPESRWSEQDFMYQLDMLRRQWTDDGIVTNKNHYLRWEGDVQFYQWCERAGIQVEQSKGGTKQGNKGFLFGTCHPYRPIASAEQFNRIINVWSVPTLAWDPPHALRCTLNEALALLERAVEVNGVAHFLFHPGIVDKEDRGKTPADALEVLARRGRELGLRWMRADEMVSWLQRRGQIQMTLRQNGVDSLTIHLQSRERVQGVTLLVWRQNDDHIWRVADHGGTDFVAQNKQQFGCPVTELVLDVSSGETIVELILDGHRDKND